MKFIKRLTLLIIPTMLLSSCSFFDSIMNFFSSSDVAEEEVVNDEGLKRITPKYTYKDVANNSCYAISFSPSKGTSNLLVIPVWFTDSSNYIKPEKRDTVKNDIYKAYFGTETDTGWESVSSYYFKDSFENINITGTVSDWYECNKPSSYFYKENAQNNITKTIVSEAVDWYKQKYNKTNLKEFDKDNDGYLDGVMLIYGAPDYTTLGNGSADNMWAYCYWIGNKSAKNVFNPGANAYFWASYDFMYNSATSFLRTGYSFGAGDTSRINIDAHTYIHEMGHIFGLEDYYDYSKKTSPAGGFSMQDLNIGAHDPYSRIALGWVKPYVPSQSGIINIKPIEKSGDVILLKNGWDGSPFDEYILIEYYTKDGLNKLDSSYSYQGGHPQGSSSNGIRIWHVDARLFSYDPSTYDPDILGFTDGEITTNPKDGYVRHANSNSTQLDKLHSTNLGGSYDYRINYFVRNNKTLSYDNAKDYQSKSTLFLEGDTFTINDYSS